MKQWQDLKQRVLRVPIILRYGLALSAGIVILKTSEYQLFSFRYSHDLYSGILAVFFLVVGIVVAYMVFGTRSNNAIHSPELKEPLTASERRVLAGLIEGRSNQQLADQNNVSVNTIKSHLKNLYRKLQVRNRAEAVSLAKKGSLL